MQLAQLFQRSSLFWTIIKHIFPAEEIKGGKVCGLSQALQGLPLHRVHLQELTPLLLLLISTTVRI